MNSANKDWEYISKDGNFHSDPSSQSHFKPIFREPSPHYNWSYPRSGGQSQENISSECGLVSLSLMCLRTMVTLIAAFSTIIFKGSHITIGVSTTSLRLPPCDGVAGRKSCHQAMGSLDPQIRMKFWDFLVFLLAMCGHLNLRLQGSLCFSRGGLPHERRGRTRPGAWVRQY